MVQPAAAAGVRAGSSQLGSDAPATRERVHLLTTTPPPRAPLCPTLPTSQYALRGFGLSAYETLRGHNVRVSSHPTNHSVAADAELVGMILPATHPHNASCNCCPSAAASLHLRLASI